MQYYQVPDLKNNDIRRLARRSLSGKWTKAMIPMLIITVALLLPALIQYQDLLSSGVLNADNMQDLQNVIDRLESRESGFLYSVLSLFSFLCTGAFSLAAAALSVRILRKEPVGPKTAFIGFRQFFQAFLVDLLTSLFSIFWSLITILPGTLVLLYCSRSAALSLIGFIVFIAAVIGYIFLILRYSLSFFIAQDNGRLPALHAIRYSVTLMRGRTGKFFALQFSFIGWILLASIPVGAGTMFLNVSSQSGSVLLRFIAVCLILIGLVTVAMVQLYLNTADAVFYSAVSGNFGIAGSDSPSGGEDEEKKSEEETPPLPPASETDSAEAPVEDAGSDALREQNDSVGIDREDVAEDNGNSTESTEDA